MIGEGGRIRASGARTIHSRFDYTRWQSIGKRDTVVSFYVPAPNESRHSQSVTSAIGCGRHVPILEIYTQIAHTP